MEGVIREIDEHRWRGRSEKELQSIYVDRDYARDVNRKSPQGVVKIIGYRQGGKAVRQTMEYIARTNELDKEELELEDQDGKKLKGKEAIGELVKEWKKEFESLQRNQNSRHATHILLSADTEPNEDNYNKLEIAARDLLRREFGDKGYDYVFVVHRDTQNPHVHILVKNRQREIGQEKAKKLRINQKDLLHLRRQFAFELERNGIEQIATRTKDDPKRCLASIQQRIDGVRENMNWYQSKIAEANWKNEKRDMHAFVSNMQKELLHIRELTIKSNLPMKQQQELARKHYKPMMQKLDRLRKDRAHNVELIRQSVLHYKTRVLSEVEKSQKKAEIISQYLDQHLRKINENRTALEQLDDKTISDIEVRLEKIKTKLTNHYPQLSIKDAEFLGLNTENLPKVKRKIVFKSLNIKDTQLQDKLVSIVSELSVEMQGELHKAIKHGEVSLSALEKAGIDIKTVVGFKKSMVKDKKINIEIVDLNALDLSQIANKAPKRVETQEMYETQTKRVDVENSFADQVISDRVDRRFNDVLELDHVKATKHKDAFEISSVQTIHKAREQIKELNAGIVNIEKQITDINLVMKNVANSKATNKEVRQHNSDLKKIKDEFVSGVQELIKTKGVLIDNAIEADLIAKKLDPNVRRMQRDLLHKTMESYHATLEKSRRLVSREVGFMNRSTILKEINLQQKKIEKSFILGLGL